MAFSLENGQKLRVNAGFASSFSSELLGLFHRKMIKNLGKMQVFTILRRLGDMLGPLGVSWAHLRLSWGHLGPSWGHLGAILGQLGPSCGNFGASWGHLGTILGVSWGI